MGETHRLHFPHKLSNTGVGMNVHAHTTHAQGVCTHKCTLTHAHMDMVFAHMNAYRHFLAIETYFFGSSVNIL